MTGTSKMRGSLRDGCTSKVEVSSSGTGASLVVVEDGVEVDGSVVVACVVVGGSVLSAGVADAVAHAHNAAERTARSAVRLILIFLMVLIVRT